MSASRRPLWSGEAADRAMAVVREIAAVSEWVVSPSDHLAAEAVPVWQSVLHSGWAGRSLLPAYLALAGEGEEYGDTALEWLDRATDAAAGLAMSASLFTGFSGIACAESHLENRLFSADDEAELQVDEILTVALSDSSWEGGFDLFDGLAGGGGGGRPGF